MKAFLMTKIVTATPMNRADYNEYRGWDLPVDEQGWDEGYLIEGINGMIANHPAHSGYISWLPKELFEESARELKGLTFGEAIEAARLGCRIARAGWNGKGMFVVYQKGYPEGIPANKNTAEAFGIEEGSLFKVRPYLQMRCADGSHQMWTASQSDILEDDWEVV